MLSHGCEKAAKISCLVIYSYLKNRAFTVVERGTKSWTWVHERGTICQWKVYERGTFSIEKMLYKRQGLGPRGGAPPPPPYKTLVRIPPPTSTFKLIMKYETRSDGLTSPSYDAMIWTETTSYNTTSMISLVFVCWLVGPTGEVLENPIVNSATHLTSPDMVAPPTAVIQRHYVSLPHKTGE